MQRMVRRMQPASSGSGALDGMVALVTGGGSGLGAAFSRRLARDGAHIVVNDLNAEGAAAIAEEVCGSTAIFDVTDAATFDAAVDDAVARHGRLDVVVNNAGIAPPPDPERFERAIANQMLRIEGRIAEMPPLDAFVSLTDDAWDLMIRTHLYGAFHGTRAAVRHMQRRRSGSIINISSVLALQPSAGTADYAAAKAGIIALTKAVAQEVAHLGIRVNAVCPGYVDTPLLKHLDDTMRTMVTMRIGMGRMATADEIAELVRFLAGPESSYSTGDVYPATGGYA
jgi:NAD(P)-dependent dehydrogenase (short-subunit alcohol dehydrogenase family)